MCIKDFYKFRNFLESQKEKRTIEEYRVLEIIFFSGRMLTFSDISILYKHKHSEPISDKELNLFLSRFVDDNKILEFMHFESHSFLGDNHPLNPDPFPDDSVHCVDCASWSIYGPNFLRATKKRRWF